MKRHGVHITVGFTGTQRGLTEAQLHELKLQLRSLYEKGYRVFQHGDCVGADAQAHLLADLLGYRTVLYPSTIESKRARSPGAWREYPPQDPLVRNRAIVDTSDILVACPSSRLEIVRSGTWYTIRYARKKRVPVAYIY